jgi:hypothetical protein
MDDLITPEMLAQTGIVIADGQVAEYLKLLNDQLTDRVGQAILDVLTDDQIDDLAEVQGSADDEALSAWLAENVKELDDIIQDEIDILLGEAAENSDKINEIEKDAA